MTRETVGKAAVWAALAVAGAILGHLFLVAPLEAYAASYPYIDDVTERVDGKANVTVTASGKHKMRLRVVDCKTGKKARAFNAKRGVWLVVVKTKRAYKYQVRDCKARKWRTIRYRIG